MEERDVGAKAIVFSQFVNMLDLVDYRIQLGGLKTVKLMGSMNIEQRDRVCALNATTLDFCVDFFLCRQFSRSSPTPLSRCC